MMDCIFGRGRQHGMPREAKHCRFACLAGDFPLNLIAWDSVRLPKLLAT